MTRIDRYRAYFLLMDLATLVTLAGLVQFILDPSSALDGGDATPWHLAIGIVGLILPGFLIFAGFMRDEFAELLWQRAAATTIKGLVVLPICALFTAGLIDGLLARDAANPMTLIDGAETLALMWTLLLSLFVLAFQWHRWRASR